MLRKNSWEIPWKDVKKFLSQILTLKIKYDQNRLKYFIKKNKYTLIPLGLINLDIRF